MAGNVDMLDRLRSETLGLLGGIDEIFPFYLTASFLDGGYTCCSMIMALSSAFGNDCLIFYDRDDLGYTVLDNLMITVPLSHRSVRPEHVSARLNPPDHSPGEEKDIWGRWDANSPDVRALFRHGYSRIQQSESMPSATA